MENRSENMQCPGRNQNNRISFQSKLINQSNLHEDDYYKFSNSSNHSQIEAAEEFEREEDMDDYNNGFKDVQQFNTQNFYNRQHFVGNRVVPRDKSFK